MINALDLPARFRRQFMLFASGLALGCLADRVAYLHPYKLKENPRNQVPEPTTHDGILSKKQAQNLT